MAKERCCPLIQGAQSESCMLREKVNEKEVGRRVERMRETERERGRKG